MQAWRFRLQKVLEARQTAEEKRRQELATALRVLEREQHRLTAFQHEFEMRRRDALEARAKSFDAQREMGYQAVLESIGKAIARQQVAITHCEQRVVAKRAALIQATMARKVLERLREKSRQAHRREVSFREQLEMDEMASAAFRRGQHDKVPSD